MTVRGPNLRLEGSTLGPRKISAWREAVAPFWDVRIRKEDTPDFRGQSEVYHLGNAIVGFTAASELRAERNRSLVARMGVDHMAIQIRTLGNASIRTTRGETAMTPGDVCLLDLSQTLSFDSGDYRAKTFIMPRGLFPQAGALLGNAHGTVIRGATPFGTLVNDHLTSLGENAPRFSPAEARSATQATAILLDMAARSTVGVSDPVQPAQGVPVFLTIRRYIDTELTSPDLSVDHLCLRFGISRSGLYRLFAPLGGVVEYVRRRRLARAYRELSMAGVAGIRVSEVAYRYGYGSPASFTQAFRHEFGMSPAEVRAGAPSASPLGGGHAPASLPAKSWDDFYDWVLKLDV